MLPIILFTIIFTFLCCLTHRSKADYRNALKQHAVYNSKRYTKHHSPKRNKHVTMFGAA